MTNQHSNHAVPENGLTEAAVDGLLKDFFRLEVPLALSRPPVRQLVSVVPHTAARPLRAASRIAIPAALAALAAGMLFTLSGEPVPPPNSGIATRSLPTTPAQDAPPELLPVSSNPDADAAAVPVDENGLLLRETEEIQLNPRQ